MYRLYSAAGQLLYIGMGGSPIHRLRAHALTKSWWRDVDPTKTTVEWYDRYKKAEAAEQRAIETEGPLHNKRHSPTWEHPARARSADIAARRAASGAISITTARNNLSEVARVAWIQRTCVTIESRAGRPVAVVVPAELGEAVLAVGGPDKAEEILTAYLAGGKR